MARFALGPVDGDALQKWLAYAEYVANRARLEQLRFDLAGLKDRLSIESQKLLIQQAAIATEAALGRYRAAVDQQRRRRR